MSINTKEVLNIKNKIDDYSKTFNYLRTKLTSSDVWQGKASCHMFEESDKIINHKEKIDGELNNLIKVIELNNEYEELIIKKEELQKLLNNQNELIEKSNALIKKYNVSEDTKNILNEESNLESLTLKRQEILKKIRTYSARMEEIVTLERQLGVNLKTKEVSIVEDFDINDVNTSLVTDKNKLLNDAASVITSSVISTIAYTEPIKYGSSSMNTSYVVTTNNKKYELADEDLKVLTAVVGDSVGVNTASESLAITSTILNRYELGYGDSIMDIVKGGAYSSYNNNNYLKYMENGEYYNTEKYNIVSKAVSDAINGVRNIPLDFIGFKGDGTYNYFRKEA